MCIQSVSTSSAQSVSQLQHQQLAANRIEAARLQAKPAAASEESSESPAQRAAEARASGTGELLDAVA